MVFFLPGWLITSQELKQTFAADGVSRSFKDEGAAAAGADQLVDFANQIFGQDYVCAYGTHTISVT
jgi:hypothetical protein